MIYKIQSSNMKTRGDKFYCKAAKLQIRTKLWQRFQLMIDFPYSEWLQRLLFLFENRATWYLPVRMLGASQHEIED